MRVLTICLALVFTASPSHGESKYTREHAEELFHLIEWDDYTTETFQRALDEKKPIYIVLSAPAWCYWCHVYESEDYLYHPDLYPFINENFIAVFIDSDKRPDLTKKYLEGGWPSTTILSPDMKRLEGFSGPRDPQQIREYLEEVISYVKDKSFTSAADDLTYRFTEPRLPQESELGYIQLAMLSYLKKSYDPKFGGFGKGRGGQQFHTAFSYTFLLEQYIVSENSDYLEMVKNTFDNQFTDIKDLHSDYHLYDPVEGGFHRYSTNPDWSVPHYEKLLVDQAGLLRAYTHLLKITGDENVNTAVTGSFSYILSRLTANDGCFYNSQDAYLEEDYYGMSAGDRAKLTPPFIDRTRVMDSSALMTSSLLYAFATIGNEQYKQAAQKCLEFMSSEMIGEHGAYSYYDYEKQKPFLTGQSISNSWAITAFLDGYDLLKNKDYLNTAEKLATYSLFNIYDWKSGGFFERNSRDSEMYAPNEQIDLSKPYQENAVLADAMLRLYTTTNKIAYLESGLKTLGYILATRPRSPDDMYYTVKASQTVKENDLLSEYERNSTAIESLVKQVMPDFFLNDAIQDEKKIMPEDLPPKMKSNLSESGFAVLTVLAFLAGVLSFLSPCTLPILPAYFAQGFSEGKGKVVINTLFFFFGLALIFSLFGMGATFLGNILREHREIFTQTAGTIILTFGIMEIFGKSFSGLNISLKDGQRTPLGSLLFGAVFALGWSACIGPILASFLLLSASFQTMLQGSTLLFIYACGLALPLLLVSLFFDRLKNKRFWQIIKGRELTFSLLGYKLHLHSTYVISGLMLITLGVLILTDSLNRLSQATIELDYVKEIIIGGEEFLKDLLL